MKRINNGVFLYEGKTILSEDNLNPSEIKSKLASLGHPWEGDDALLQKDIAKDSTLAYSILKNHNKGTKEQLQIRFDALASHDITYVGIIQTARASGLEAFDIPYVLTNCHNSLCAVGGTINEDDHIFGLSAAKRYGGIFVPAHLAVIHQYMREMHAGCGKMILGSDSHTRYGAIGTLGVGEGGPEIVKQILNNTYDINRPEVVLIHLTGKPQKGVGPQDVALAIIGEVFADGFVKNKIMEFCGEGVKNLSMDFRIGIDVMTTETTCLSSIWETDEKTREYLKIHGRESEYTQLSPGKLAYYDSALIIDLSKIKPMIALPFHPSNVYTIEDLNNNAVDILTKVQEEGRKEFNNKDIDFNLTNKIIDGILHVDQGIIAGCSGGTYENIMEAAAILKGQSTGDSYFSLSVYPSSQPVNLALTKNGTISELMEVGAIIRSAFCGPCFGAGDVPGNNGISIRHTTRNFFNREGSKPDMGQISSVALMDSRSIAATALNKGRLTPATEVEIADYDDSYTFDKNVYDKRVYYGFGKPEKDSKLRFGPNIADWPEILSMKDNLILKVASVIKDPVTTTDELIPSGETSSYRSNPYKLAEFTLSRKDPAYVGKAKAVYEIELDRRKGKVADEIKKVLSLTGENEDVEYSIGSVIYANKPGDGSAREQAASCQKVLGGQANIAKEYATKRYRSNLINWGMVPFTIPSDFEFNYDDGAYIYIKGIKEAIIEGKENIIAKIVLKDDTVADLPLILKDINETEKEILLCGSLINYYASKR